MEKNQVSEHPKKYKFYETGSILSITQKDETQKEKAQKENVICTIDRNKLKFLQENTTQPPRENFKFDFHFILGLFKYEISRDKEDTGIDKTQKESMHSLVYFLVLVTDIESMEQENCFSVFRIKSFEIIPLSNELNSGSKKFSKLLKSGLNQCEMYFSDNYNLTLTLQQHFENLPSRKLFIWNYEAIKCLKQKWENAKGFKEVIGGHFKMKYPFIIISRKSNKNGGCHTWNRGADVNGYAANFVENEEIFIFKNNNNSRNEESVEMSLKDGGESSEYFNESIRRINDGNFCAFSHIEIGGSCPIFWSQYPTMQISRPFHFGPQDECERRFNLHFNELTKNYANDNDQENENDSPKCPIVIVSLLSNKGKEGKLNSIYKDLADKKKIKFISMDFNNLMKTEGMLTDEISNIVKSFNNSMKADSPIDYIFSEIENGVIKKYQKIIPRVNCSSCLDRTSVFMEISFQFIFNELQPDIFQEITHIHKNLWLDRSDTISREYAMTRGMKTYLIKNDYQTVLNKYADYTVQIQRFIYSIFYEGNCTDAYNAVLQERNFTRFDKAELFGKITLFIQLIFIFIYLYLFEGHGLAIHTWKAKIKEIINHPHIPDLRDADEFDNIDCNNMREISNGNKIAI